MAERSPFVPRNDVMSTGSLWKLRCTLVAVVALLVGGFVPMTAHETEDRLALFDYLLDATIRRYAFSPPKNQRLRLDFRRDALNLRDDFARAETDPGLYQAIIRFQRLLRDRHLDVFPVEGGLNVTREVHRAPIRFAPDFGSRKVRLYVSQLGAPPADEVEKVRFGHELKTVNGLALKDYVTLLEPYLRYSSKNGRLWEIAKAVQTRNTAFPSPLAPEHFVYGLTSESGEAYEVTLRARPEESIFSREMENRTFPGFRVIQLCASYRLLAHEGGLPILLLDWVGFDTHLLPGDLRRLIDCALKEDLLDHHVIVDATQARGGMNSPLLIQVLTGRSFKITFGNLRCSDVLPRMARGTEDAGRVKDWLQFDAIRDLEQGLAYTQSVPFKLRHLPQGSRGILPPAPNHFTGKLVCLFGSNAGSQVDQFAAMVIDNRLGYAIGMPTGGYSNTWEWAETLVFPTTKKPVVNFEWSVGHTIRPNGQVLEGNPAEVDELVPLTRANFARYYDDLLERAIQYVLREEE